MKIMIIGYSGSGKSTLAKALHEKYNGELLYLDTLHWLPNWVEKDNDLELKEFNDFLDQNQNWIIDGNYFKLDLNRRLEESDKIILLLLNRFSCLARAIKRRNRYKHKSRESMTVGCDEKIDFSFLMWIMFKGRTRKRKNVYKDIINKYSNKAIVIRNKKELKDFYIKENIKATL